MFRLVNLALLCAAAMPAGAYGQTAAGAQRPFEGLWTGWRDINRSALAIEKSEVEEVREDYVTAGSERRRQLQNQGRALGERVGEIVRAGDCEEGERVARAAGDFALVEAVRAHCRDAEPSD